MQNRTRPIRQLGNLLGLVLELPPAAYVAITGHAPTWVRAWFVVWIAVWLLCTVLLANRSRTH